MPRDIGSNVSGSPVSEPVSIPGTGTPLQSLQRPRTPPNHRSTGIRTDARFWPLKLDADS